MAVWGCCMKICWVWPCWPCSCRVWPPCNWIWPGWTNWIYIYTNKSEITQTDINFSNTIYKPHKIKKNEYLLNKICALITIKTFIKSSTMSIDKKILRTFYCYIYDNLLFYWSSFPHIDKQSCTYLLKSLSSRHGHLHDRLALSSRHGLNHDGLTWGCNQLPATHLNHQRLTLDLSAHIHWTLAWGQRSDTDNQHNIRPAHAAVSITQCIWQHLLWNLNNPAMFLRLIYNK